MLQKNIHSENRTILKDAIPLAQPLCISIEPTNLCNFKCVMCFHGNNESDPKAQPLKNIEPKVFDKTLNDIREWVAETGKRIKLIKLYSLGEPFVNSDVCEMVRKIKKMEICDQVEITTNGSLITQETARQLVDDGLDILRISVYSIEKERMKYVTQSEVSPDVIYQNLLYLKKYRDESNKKNPVLYAKMLDTNTGENEEFLKKYEKVADFVGLDEVFQISLGEGHDAFANMYQEGAEQAHQKSLGSNAAATSHRHPCRYPFSHITIRNDGSVIMCCADWLKELKIGNIMDHSLKEFWESKSMYNLRCDMLKTKGQKWEACRNCEIPYRDAPEDDVSEVSVDQLSWKNDY